MMAAWQGYLPRDEEIPLGGYAAILAGFAGIFGPMLYAADRAGRLPRRWRARDIVLIGLATHKLTRILTRDWVTAPLRAPFTHYEKSLGNGEVEDKARGHGLQRALGDLVTCPFCTGPWVAATLGALLLARPRLGRTIASTLTMVTVSDWAHRLYGRL